MPTFGFSVPDVEARRSILLDKGVPMMGIVQSALGVFVCSGRDPEGNRFSIESGKN